MNPDNDVNPYYCFVKVTEYITPRVSEILKIMFNTKAGDDRVHLVPGQPQLILVEGITNPKTELIDPCTNTFLVKYVARVFVTKKLGQAPHVSRETVILKMKEQSEGQRYRIQAIPTTTEVRWAGDAEPECSSSPSDFTHVASIVQVEDTWYYHVVPKEWLFRTFNRKYKTEDEKKYCKAKWKIQECDFRYDFVSRFTSPTGEVVTEPRVLDIGASPGGWSKYLGEHGWRVTAVDGAELPFCVGMDNVTHLKERAQVVIPQIEQLGPYDMLVCDINSHVDMALRDVVFPLLHVVKEGGLVIVTFKFANKYPCHLGPAFKRHQESQVAEKVAIMEEHVSDVHCHFLLQNTPYERTAVGRITRRPR